MIRRPRRSPASSTRERIGMKSLVCCVLFLLAAVARPGRAAEGEALTLQNLVNRPDLWPPSVTLGRDISFSSGKSVKNGQVVKVVQFDGAQVLVDAGNGLVFDVAAADCDLVGAANKIWTALTPAQRAVDAKKLLEDASLWPERVKCAAEFGLDDGTRLAPDTEYEFLSYDREGVKLYSREHSTRLLADLAQTDLVARARQRALIEPDKRPSRIAALLKGKLVDADGKPFASATIDDAKVYAFYFSASWCGPCRKFSPSLIEFVNKVAKDNPHLATVLVSNDEKPEDMLAYMKEEKMPWPAFSLASLRESPILMGLAANSIPHLVVLDRHGLVLASSLENGQYTSVQRPFQALVKLVEAGKAK